MRAAAVLAGLLITAQPVSALAQPAAVKPGAWRHFDVWLDAIAGHDPGANDAALASAAALSSRELESVLPYMVFALRGAYAKLDRRAEFDETFNRYGTRGHQPKDAGELQARVSRLLAPPGVDRFLKRAAMLHTDLGIVHRDSHVTQTAGLSHLVEDGRAVGDAGRPWHWMMARAFLHLVPRAAEDPDVRLWYQAVGTHLWSSRTFTEAMPHLRRAAEIFPGDAEIQFLLGVCHEALAAPHIQSAVASRLAMMSSEEAARYQPGVQAADRENEDAREAFQKAVRADASHAEARVRLGRAWLLHGEYAQAVDELNAALEQTGNPVLRYLTHLFLGRAYERRGRGDLASAAYEAASVLFPLAQSPRLAISQLALQAGERDATRGIVAFLSLPAAREADDPWWSYHWERERDHRVWIARLREAFARATK